MKERTTKSFIDHLLILTKWRLLIAKIFVMGTGTAVIISLMITPKYTATSTILPPNTSQDLMMGILSSGLGGGLSGLAEIAGIPGMSSPSDLYAEIMQSASIKDALIEMFDLQDEFKTRTMQDTYEALDEITSISVSPVGIISIEVQYKNKLLAADLANAYVDELDKFNTETAMTVGKRYRIFIEERLTAAEDTLIQAEEALRSFQEKNRTVALDAEIQAAIETIAQLKSQIILNEVQRGAYSSAGQSGNPYLYNINRELRELRKQLSKIEFGDKDGGDKEFGAGFSVPLTQLPEISLQYARLLRDLKVQEAIFELLTQQYEQAKIMELKDTPTVQVLDRALPPEKKSSPRRSRIVIFAAILSLIGGMTLALGLESAQNLRDRSSEFAKWSAVYTRLRQDLDTLKNRFDKLLHRKKSTR